MFAIIKTSGTRASLASTLAAWLLFTATCLGGLASEALAVRPTLTSITLNGDMTDWDVVLANAANVTIDGDGSSLACAMSSDLDCPVVVASRDIARFAWTYDGAAIHLYLERFANSAGSVSVWMLFDVDRDDLLLSTDRLVQFLWDGSARETRALVYEYSPAMPSGDTFVGGDGWDIRGNAGALLSSSGPVTSGDVAGIRLEQSVAWSDLGIAPRSPVPFHVAISTDAAGPAGDDNAGSGDGGPATTGWTALDLDDPITVAASPGTSVELPHLVRNDGNLSDIVNFDVELSMALPLELWSDSNRDGTPDALMATDADGDGTFELIEPGWDDDGDGRPDAGFVGGGRSFGVVMIVDLPPAPATVDATVKLTATARDDPTASDSVRDRVVAGSLTLTPAWDWSLAPGETLAWQHDLVNLSPVSLDLDIVDDSFLGWAYDVTIDGMPVTANDGVADVTLAPGESAVVVSTTTVPAVPFDTQELYSLRALAPGGDPQAGTTDRLVVRPAVELVPSHLVADGTNGRVGAGRAVLYAHVLRNNTASAESFTVFFLSQLGWSTRIFSDPDLDQNPDEDITFTSRVENVASHGGKTGLVVEVQAPASAPIDAVERTELVAAPDSDPSADASVFDETVVAQMVTFRDAARLFPRTHFVRCDTVYTAAYGLEPGLAGTFAFRWFDDTGAVVRDQPFDSDAAGQGFDELVLPGDAQGTWQISLIRDGSAVTTTSFTVEPGFAVDELVAEPPVLPVAGGDLTVRFTLANRNAVAGLPASTATVTVLDPSRTLYLDAASATFQPHFGQVTRSFSIDALAAGEQAMRSTTIAAVVHPEEGTYPVVLEWETPCAGLDGQEETSYEVEPPPDADGDTIPDDSDNCIDTANTDQSDVDSDGVGDACDNCVDTANADQSDVDSDTVGDACDNCIDTANTDQADGDSDTVGDACDNCPLVPNTDQADGDGNGIGDACDGGCSGAALPEVEGLRVMKAGPGLSDLSLTWDSLAPIEPCVEYEVLEAVSPTREIAGVPDALADFTSIATGLATPSHVVPDAIGDGTLRFYLVRASSPDQGDGPLGHYGE